MVYETRHLASFNPIISLPAPHQTVLQQQCAVPIQKIPSIHLLNFNSYGKKNGQFRCMARIFRFSPGVKWWITCCTRCGHLAMPATISSTQPDVYKCSRIACPCTTATLLYRLCLIGRDTSGEAEFILNQNAGQTMIGLSADEVVKRNYHGASPVTNMHVAASQIRNIPSEFKHVHSMLCSFIVNVAADSLCGRWPSFVVTRVESCHPAPVIDSATHA